MERNENPSEPVDRAIREGEPPFRNEAYPESCDMPTLSPSEPFQREMNRRKRELLFFWISISVFAATIPAAILAFLLRGRVGMLLLFLAPVGILVSVTFCALAIRRKGAIILIIVESLSFILALLLFGWLIVGFIVLGAPKR
jgi:hypothetical protein